MADENLFDTVFQISPLPMIILNRATLKFININPAAVATFGYTREEMIGMPLLELVPKSNQEKLLRNLEQVAEGKDTNFYLKNLKKSGEVIEFKITATTVSYEGKDCILKIAKDINTTLFEKLFNASPMAIALLNEDEEVKRVNKTFEETFGFPAEEIINKTLEGFIIPSDLVSEHREITAKVKEGQFIQIQTKRKRKNNSLIDVLAVRFPVFIDDYFKGSYSIFLDISEEKKAQRSLAKLSSELEKRVHARTEELEAAYQRLEEINLDLEEINKAKDKIISIISHDLRNPITAIVTSSEMLMKSMAIHEQEVEQLAKIINNSSVKIVKQLNDLVEWSKQKVKRINFNPQDKNLYESVLLSVDILEANAKEKDINIKVDMKGDLEVWADPLLLRSIFQNLITNSLKFTKEKGDIIISAFPKTDSFIEVTIQDTGAGMPEEVSKRLFSDESAFSESESVTESDRQHGLGLILVKDFVEKHKGKIWVESEVGVGTTVHFTLPVRASVHGSTSTG